MGYACKLSDSSKSKPIYYNYGRFPSSGNMQPRTYYEIPISKSLFSITGVVMYYTDSFQGSGYMFFFLDENGNTIKYLGYGDYFDSLRINPTNNKIAWTTINSSWYGFGNFSGIAIVGYK